MPFKANKAIIITGDLHRVRLALDKFPSKPLVTLGLMNASIGAYATNVAAEVPAGRPKGMPPKLPLSEITFTGRYGELDKTIAKRWLDQMRAGYRALYITRSFQGQLKHYLSKTDRAEAGLRKLIFCRKEEIAKS